MAGVDDDAIVAAFIPLTPHLGLAFADQKAGNLLDGLLRRRQTDARRRQWCQRRQAFERQGEMAAALVARERVDFVDDDGARRRQHFAARLGAEQDVQRLGRRDDDVRRPLAHPGALGLRCVAGADQCANLDIG